MISFGLVNERGNLTNAGALLADESPIRCSRLFCTRWNGLNKSGGAVDALDDAEYSGRLEKYKVMVQTKCVVLKIKALWNSSENNLYGIDKKRAIKCIPDIENYEYVPVNNSMLAKAEISFLIFERNRGKCFIEMY